MVPVIVHAGGFDIWGLAGELARLADAAKSRKIKREELTGSTITLTSLGSMGGLVSTPIINAPEVAIIGVNKISMRQVWRDGGFVARKIMNLSSSFDHRVIDGWDAATFIQEVKSFIENPAKLLD
jgi:2-oxoisovalerate dehydrogenase E2 component (dihydrolipoyl transacylase)